MRYILGSGCIRECIHLSGNDALLLVRFLLVPCDRLVRSPDPGADLGHGIVIHPGGLGHFIRHGGTLGHELPSPAPELRQLSNKFSGEFCQ